jgi:hypothetical protein
MESLENMAIKSLTTPPPQNPCDYHADYKAEEFHRESLPVTKYHELREQISAILETDWPMRVKEERIMDCVINLK